MANVIRHKRGTSDPVAGDFSNTGELLVNTSDGGVFTKTDGGTVVEIGSTAASLTTARTIALSGDVSGSTSFDGSANVTITATVADDSHNHVISNVDGLQTALDAKAPLASPALTGTPTAPTAAAGTNTTQVATTAFVSTAVANVVDSAPGALDTLNELAAALGDDANFSTTVTNSIATKLPLSGGQMTGNITFSSTQTVDGRDLSVDGAKLDGIAAGAQVNVATNLAQGTRTTTTVPVTSSTGTDATLTAATTSLAGVMTSADKSKLDGIATGATNVTNNNQLTNGAGYITSSGSISGNAATATTLQTARTIQGVSFNGSANITVVTAGSGISVSGTTVTNSGVRSLNGSTGVLTNFAKTDSTQTYTAPQRGGTTSLSSSSSITPNFGSRNNFTLTLSTNTTIQNPSNLTAGQSGVIILTYSGNRTVAFGSYWKFPGGTAPTMTSTSGKVDAIVYYVESSTRISAQVLLNMGG